MKNISSMKKQNAPIWQAVPPLSDIWFCMAMSMRLHTIKDTNPQLTLTNIPAIKKQLIYSEYDTTMEELETRIIENEIDYALIVNCYYP